MKLPILFLTIWGGSLAGSIALYLKSPEDQNLGAYVATLRSGSGEILFREPFCSTWRAVKPRQRFQSGTVVSTGANSHALIQMSQGQVLAIPANSQIGIGGTEASARQGMLVSIFSGAVAVKKSKEKPSFLQRALPIPITIPMPVLATVRKFVGTPAKVFEVRAGDLSLSLAAATESIAAAKVGSGLTVVTTGGGVVAKRDNSVATELATNTPLLLNSNAKKDELKVATPAPQAVAVQKTLDDLGRQMAELAINDIPEPIAEKTEEPIIEKTQEPITEKTQEPIAEKTQEPTPEPTSEPTTEPTPLVLPFSPDDWAMAVPKPGLLWVATEAIATPGHAPLEVTIEHLPASAVLDQGPILQVSQADNPKNSFRLRPRRTKGNRATYLVPSAKVAEWTGLTKGRLELEFRALSPLDAQAASEAKEQKPLGRLSLVSIPELEEGTYLLSLRSLRRRNHRPEEWIQGRPFTQGAKPTDVKIFLRSKKQMQAWFLELDIGSGVQLERWDGPQPEGIIAANSEGVEAIVSGGSRNEREICDAALAATKSTLCYLGSSSDYVPFGALAEALSDKANTNSAPSDLYFVDQTNQYRFKRSILREFSGLTTLLSSSQLRVFSRSVKLLRDLQPVGTNRPVVSSAEAPRAILASTSPQRAGIVMIAVVNQQLVYPNWKTFGIEEPSLFSMRAVELLRANLMVNGVAPDVLLEGTDDEIPLFKTLAKVVNADLLLVLRTKPDKILSGRLIGNSHDGAAVIRENVLKNGKSLPAWFETQMGYQGVVAAQSDNWVQVTSMAAVPKTGQRGIVYAGTSAKHWLPALTNSELPAAVIVCEKPLDRSCASRILFLSSDSKKSLVEKKVRWLEE